MEGLVEGIRGWLGEPIAALLLVEGVGDNLKQFVERGDGAVRGGFEGFFYEVVWLTPGERVAFVLHDVFSLPFDEVGEIVGRSSQACRQLAARARRRIHNDSTTTRPPTNPEEHREIVERFAAACKQGNLKALVDVLAAEATGDFDSGGLMPGAPLTEVDGAEAIAAQLVAAVSGFGAEFTVRDINGDPGVLITNSG